MHITIARLRLWILVLAVLLVAALVGNFIYGRWKAKGLLSDLPRRLGGDVVESSDAFTYSQSEKGRTAFTIHANKAIQYKGGTSATLHDVVITLYGAQGDRSDRISGSEFNYDKKAGLVSAQGDVQIDLQGADLTGPAAKDVAAAGKEKDISLGTVQQVVHIKTSGLVFNQNTQLASTTQYVEFSTPKGMGHASGATYDVQKGLLILQSAVELRSSRDGVPVVVNASHAEFLRSSMQAFLLNPVSKYQSERTTADQAIVYFRQDGSAEHIDAEGHIHLTTDDGKEMTAGRAKIMLDAHSQPQSADASGGVNFVSLGDPQQQMHGNAVEGTLTFAPGGGLSHAQARNAVSFVDQQRGLSDDPEGSATRELRAAQVDVDFVEDAEGHSAADKVLAAGGATAVLHMIRTKGASQNTTIKGDQLLATLRDGRAISSLHGTGHTSVLDISPTGATNLSSGDTLQVDFSATKGQSRPAGTAKPSPAGVVLDTTQIESVVQEGNVVMVQTPAPNPAHPGSPTRAVAQRANYEAASQLLKLTGSPRIDDGTSDITADAIDYHRDTEVAEAKGDVKATYRQTATASTPGVGAKTNSAPGIGGEGPTHVISASADLDQGHGLAVFRGKARLWQGANSVSAPVIELSRNPEMLKAYGEPASAGAVTTVISSAANGKHPPSVFSVHSRMLLYVDADRKATFTGAVVAEDPDGVVHSDKTEVFLAAASQPGKTPGPPGSSASRIERILSTGHVVLQQPGRRGTGEQLLYTAQDGKFVLTGTSTASPHLYDQARGNVTGEALIFNSQDDSVSVSGGQSKAVTDTRTAK